MSSLTKVSWEEASRAIIIIVPMNKYMYIILYIIGMIGSILNIITFLEKRIRTNPCAVYLLAASIIDFGIMNTYILIDILTAWQPMLYDLIQLTTIWCKFGNFLRFAFVCLSSNYLILASADRFCMSSSNATLRKCSSLKASRIIVIIVFLMWSLLALHYSIAYDVVRDPFSGANECTVTLGNRGTIIIISGFIMSGFNGIVTPFFLCLFGILILYNMKRSRQRVNSNSILRDNNRLLSLLLAQVILTIIFNIPFAVMYFYINFNSVTQPLQFLLAYVFGFLSRWLYYMNFCKTFYVNTLTSALFRQSLCKQFKFCFRRRRTTIDVHTH